MASKSEGQIRVCTDGVTPLLCFSVEEGTGTSGRKKQFIDIKVSNEQLEELEQAIRHYQERTKEEEE
jgi:hypothetical protein